MPHIPAGTPFAKLRVLDLTRARAGPTCVRQLADFGADVIKIESPPGLDPNANQTGARDSPDMQNLHRNKRSMTLNLKAPDGVAVFMRMVRDADVVVENYRPDVKDRLGINYEALRKVNKRIILASVSGFGQDGPYRDYPGVDQIAQGMSGIMLVTGKPGEGPMRAGAAVCDIAAGLYAALGVMTALYERQSSGEGQWVQSSLLHAGLGLLDFQAARYTVNQEIPRQVGNDHPTGMPTSSYRTQDGFINIGASGDGMWGRLCKVMGREDLHKKPEYIDGKARSKNRQALNDELNRTLATKPSAEWIEAINKAGVPCGPIYTMDQVFADPQVRHMKIAETVAHPLRGEVTLIGQATRLSRTQAKIVRPTPELGEHTDEVLREFGYTDTQIQDLRTRAVL
ncbi:MAG: CaiB/BaiF CoA transferase family protein [Burkholderiales bacterium]